MNKVFFGDCRESMQKLIAQGVKIQTCVTSPPYFGLRDYGTGTWEGGSPECDHVSHEIRTGKEMASLGEKFSGGGKKASEEKLILFRDLCGKCGAKKIDNQLGLESTPQEYINNMVNVFRLVRELLSDDGTCWVNIGDSYNAGRNGGHAGGAKQASLERHKGITRSGANVEGLKPKDLIGIPWLLAFALRADGWYLRQDIIWAKPNPMPESVTDRCTKSHEYIFLLSKSERYHYDHEAIKEKQTESSRERANYGWNGRTDDHSNGARTGSSFKKMAESGELIKTIPADGMRNKRSVWEVATQPYSGAHFACFPPALIEPCILAGSRVGDIVLDPFMGSGTTAQVAESLGRKWIGCELNSAYEELQLERTAQMGMAFA